LLLSGEASSPLPSQAPLRKKGMLQRLCGRDPFLWGQRQAALEQINEVVEITRLGITHAL